MATARENAFSHLLAPGMRKIFFEKYGQRPDEYSQVFNVDSSQRAYEEDSEVTGLGRMPEKPEGRPTTYDSPFQANVRQRYTHVSYGLGFRVTHELYEDDLYRIIRRMPTALARSAHQTIEVVSLTGLLIPALPASMVWSYAVRLIPISLVQRALAPMRINQLPM